MPIASSALSNCVIVWFSSGLESKMIVFQRHLQKPECSYHQTALQRSSILSELLKTVFRDIKLARLINLCLGRACLICLFGKGLRTGLAKGSCFGTTLRSLGGSCFLNLAGTLLLNHARNSLISGLAHCNRMMRTMSKNTSLSLLEAATGLTPSRSQNFCVSDVCSVTSLRTISLFNSRIF